MLSKDAALESDGVAVSPKLRPGVGGKRSRREVVSRRRGSFSFSEVERGVLMACLCSEGRTLWRERSECRG